MIRIVPLALLLAGSAAPAQTGEQSQSDRDFRAGFRSLMLTACRAGGSAASVERLREVGITVESMCTCVTDRYMARASSEQLRRELREAEMPPDARAATEECVRQLMNPLVPAGGPSRNET